jgi:S-adenosylmethionine:tRNA ribosyltransferase-isomerase
MPASFHSAGDAMMVINTSGTLNAALPARRSDGTELELHLSTHLPNDNWTVELRRPHNGATLPFRIAQPNEVLSLPAEGSIRLLQPYAPSSPAADGGTRLWTASL